MMKSFLKDKCLPLLLGLCLLITTGCGTILHPERKGQSGGRVDPAIVLLDGLGLLLYIIPGVIAFAVDFSNGTIYLPDSEDTSFKEGFDRDRMEAFSVKPKHLRQHVIESIIARETGRRIDLDNTNLQVTRMGHSAPSEQNIDPAE